MNTHLFPFSPLAAALACGLFASTPFPVLGQAPAAAPAAPSGPVEINAIVATVNGRVVTRNEVNFRLAAVFRELSLQFPRRGAEFERQFLAARDQIIQELIDREIILDEFKQLGAEIRPHFVEEEVRRQIRERFNNDDALFREELRANRMTMESFREMTRQGMIVQMMRAQQFAEVPPPLPEEVRAEFNRVRVNFRDTTQDLISFKKIFIPKVDARNPAATPDEQLDLADSIVAQLRGGANFEELARRHSRDAFAEQGGAQEDVPRTDLAPEFAAMLFDAGDGELIGPLDDPEGFTIVIPTSRKLGPSPSFEELREQIDTQLRVRNNAARYERWMEARRREALIDIRR